MRDREEASDFVEEGVTSGDFLFGFLRGTRQALAEQQRQSMTITVECLDAATIGALVALFERSVGLYASLININAYHQPGVEAGKKAAGAVLNLQHEILAFLATRPDAMTAPEIAATLGKPDSCEDIFCILRHLGANPERGVQAIKDGTPDRWRFRILSCPD